MSKESPTLDDLYGVGAEEADSQAIHEQDDAAALALVMPEDGGFQLSIDDVQTDLQELADALGKDHDACPLIDHVIERLVCQDAQIHTLHSTCQAALERIKEFEQHWDDKWSAEYGDLMERLHTAERKLAEAEREAQTILQAFGELNHAHTDPDWFTKGRDGANAQFRLWLDKGMAAAKAIYDAAHRGEERK